MVSNSFHFQLHHPLRSSSQPIRILTMEPNQNISSSDEIVEEFRFFKVFKDGRVEVRFPKPPATPPTYDPYFGVQIKDVSITPEISARIFLPKLPNSNTKLPLLFYIHGGGFCMQSPFSERYSNYVKKLAAEANVIAISVDYGLFPTRPIPACYEDSWTALQWALSASHVQGSGPEPFLNNHADFQRVFIGGDSAGGNITHTLVSRVGKMGLSQGVKLVGAILLHPYFGGTDDDRMWLYMHPTNEGLMDPRLKPAAGDLGRLGCEKVLVFVAEKDHLMGVGMQYVEELKKSGWNGEVELVVNWEREHCFHMSDFTDEQAIDNQKHIISFINNTHA